MNKIKLILILLAFTIFKANAQTQYIKGLTVVTEFTDAPFNNSLDSITMMMNQIGFTGWGNKGSVREYYLTQTAGKVDITNTVIKVTLNYPVSAYYDGSRNDITDIVEQINLKYPNGFQGLTTYPDGSIMHFTVLTKAARGAWAFGDQNVAPIKNNGVSARVDNGSITTYGLNQNPNYNTICHETGHAIYSWSDYYGLYSDYGQLGHYCLMSSGGSDLMPMPISAPLRYLKGWINNVNDITNASTQTFSINTNDFTQVYKYVNTRNTKEYILIDAHQHGPNYLTVDGENFAVDEGLAVWYVDEERGNGKISPYIKLIQADGLDEMTNPIYDTPELKVNLRGDLSDLFDNEYPNLNDVVIPSLKWKDGSRISLNLSNISAVGPVMTFKFNSATSGCAGVPTYCAYPCIYNNGDIVQYNGIKYKSLSNNLYNVTPGTAAQWWQNMGACGVTNAAPNVSLTAPTVLTYRAPATVNIAANATDDVSVTKVEFYNGTTLLNTDVTAPYSFSWTGVVAGNYNITAKAYDGEGLSTTSSVISIVVNNNSAPVIAITAPLPVSGIQPKYIVGGSQTVSANVTDDVSVQKVVFTLPKTGVTITDMTAPYSATFTNLPASFPDGSLGYSITAYDNEGLTMTANVIVYKNRVPSVTITTPASNANLTDNTVNIGAMVLDADWTSGKVEYFNGSTKIGEISTNVLGASPVTFTWTNVANGTYTVTAKATDDMSESSTSSSVTFSVNKTTSTCTAPEYNSATAYTTGSVVQYNGIKYTANWWTQGQRPDQNSGGAGSGKPWTSNGACNARMGSQETEVTTSLYPNPNTGKFIIESQEETTAQILNKFGNEVTTLSIAKGQNEVALTLETGIYYVKIYNKVTKLVIE